MNEAELELDQARDSLRQAMGHHDVPNLLVKDLSFAQTHAEIAIAEALVRIANALEKQE